MKGLSFVLAVIFAAALWSCGKVETIKDLNSPKKGNKEAEIIAAWIPEKLTNQNPMLNMGIYKNEIFYVTTKNDTFNVIFCKINGEKLREISIKKGKGPGELQDPFQSYIRNDVLYMYEFDRMMLSMFDLTGKHIEDIQFDGQEVMPFFTDVHEKTLFFNDPLKYRIGSMDISDVTAPKVLKKLEYENKVASLEELFKGKPRIVIPQFDSLSKTVFITQTDNGFSVSRYSEDLALQQEIISISGSIMNIGSYIDATYLYVPEVIDFEKLQKTQKSEIDFRIAVIDKMKGIHVANLVSKKLPTVKGFITILGEVDGNLVLNLMFFQPDKSLGEFAANEKMKNTESEQWFLVIKKPVGQDGKIY